MDEDHLHHHAATPTCILKMNLMCCKHCPIRLNKKLQKMNGVKSVKIDQKQGLVTVSGNIDPLIFTENVSKLGKTAELWSFHKDPSSASTLKDCCSCHGHSTTSDEDDDCQTPSTNKNGTVFITWQRPEQGTKDKKKTKKTNHIPAADAGKDLYFHGPPRPVNGRPMGFHFHSHTASEPPFSYGYNLPRPSWDPPGYNLPRPSWDPPGYPFDYGFGSGSGSGSGSGYVSRSPPKVNRMMKYTSYADNYLPY